MNEDSIKLRVACVYHRIDLDGWMSGAIVKSEIPGCDMIGYHYGDPLPNLNDYHRVYMCDVSFPRDFMIELHNNLRRDLIWIDHHISAINEMSDIDIKGSRDPHYAACELTWMYFNQTSNELVRRLGAYDCFSHKGTSEEQAILEFQYGARAFIFGIETAILYLREFYRNPTEVIREIETAGKSIYNYLRTEASSIIETSFSRYVIEEFSYGRDRISRKFMVVNRGRFNPINFGIDYHKMGYDGVISTYYDGSMWNVSFYNNNGNVNCSTIAKRFGGGGHKGAAGCRVKDLNTLFI